MHVGASLLSSLEAGPRYRQSKAFMQTAMFLFSTNQGHFLQGLNSGLGRMASPDELFLHGVCVCTSVEIRENAGSIARPFKTSSFLG